MAIGRQVICPVVGAAVAPAPDGSMYKEVLFTYLVYMRRSRNDYS